MDTGLLKTVGEIAGIGGIAIGALILIFRDVIRKNIFPKLEPQQALGLLRLIIILCFVIAPLGILASLFLHNSISEYPQEFTIALHVQDQTTGQSISGAIVTNYIENKAPMTDIKDKNGYVRFKIDTPLAQRPAKIVVEAPEYRIYDKEYRFKTRPVTNISSSSSLIVCCREGNCVLAHWFSFMGGYKMIEK